MSYTCELCCQDSLQLTPSNIELTGITSDRVEVKYILHLSCYDVLLGDEPLVTDVTEQPAQPARTGHSALLQSGGRGRVGISPSATASAATA